MAQAGDGHGAWGGPQIEWVDPQNSRATLFALDNATEEKEWCGLHVALGGVAHMLTNMLGALNGSTPTGQV